MSDTDSNSSGGIGVLGLLAFWGGFAMVILLIIFVAWARS